MSEESEKKPKKKRKIDHSFNAEGRWVEEDRRIKNAIRKVFSLSPQMKKCIDDHRTEVAVNKKNGEPAKKLRIFYPCAICGDLTPTKHIEVDHINPVVPVWREGKDISHDEYARRVFCGQDNLQILCSTPIKILGKGNSSCHKKKSREENFIRDRWKEFWEDLDVKTDKEKIEYVNNFPYSIIKNNDRFIQEYRKYLDYLQEKQNKKKNKNRRK